jgi:hypothetical protein
MLLKPPLNQPASIVHGGGGHDASKSGPQHPAAAFAVYSCGSTAYHPLALPPPFPQTPCYPMTIAPPPPVVANGSYQIY